MSERDEPHGKEIEHFLSRKLKNSRANDNREIKPNSEMFRFGFSQVKRLPGPIYKAIPNFLLPFFSFLLPVFSFMVCVGFPWSRSASLRSNQTISLFLG